MQYVFYQKKSCLFISNQNFLAVRNSIFQLLCYAEENNTTVYLILPFYNFLYTFVAYSLHRNLLIYTYIRVPKGRTKMVVKEKYSTQIKVEITSWENECVCFQCTNAENKFSKRQKLFNDHQKYRYDVLKITSEYICVSLSLCEYFKYDQKITDFIKSVRTSMKIKLFISI